MTLFYNKYRIESARLRGYDYSQAGAYFVTICTRGRVCYFGDVIDRRMILSEIGKIAEREWIATPQIRPDMQIEMDAFIIMPNHIHGIIVIGPNEYNRGDIIHRRDARHRVSTNPHSPTIHSSINSPNKIIQTQTEQDKFAPQSKNLSSINSQQLPRIC